MGLTDEPVWLALSARRSWGREELAGGIVPLHRRYVGEPVGLDARAGDASAFVERLFELGLPRPRQLARHGIGQVRVDDAVGPVDLALDRRREGIQELLGRLVGVRVAALGVIQVRAAEMRLEHPVDADEPLDGGRCVPDLLAQPDELVGRGLRAIAPRTEPGQAAPQLVGPLGVFVDVLAHGGLDVDLRRGVAPSGDHLHRLDLQVAIVGEAGGALNDVKSASKVPAINDRHLLLTSVERCSPQRRSAARDVETLPHQSDSWKDGSIL